MANALRNLQIFRNGTLITGTMDYAKSVVEAAFAQGTLVLSDGEPISIRCQESGENKPIMGLYGVAYVNGATKQIFWADSGIDLIPHFDPEHPEDTQYIHITEDGNNVYTISANVVTVNSATGAADGLASAADVKGYVEYYVDTNIKDKFVESGEVKKLIDDSQGRHPGDEGYVETIDNVNGEPYLVLTLENSDKKVYIDVKDMITQYTSGDGIIIEPNGVIGVNVSRIEEIANGVAGDRAEEAIGNLGSVTATSGNYFTEIRVNAVTGQLEAEEAALPEGGGSYTEGDDISINATAGNTINVALDDEIEVSVAMGNLKVGDKIDAGSSLSDILTQLLVKECDVDNSTKPTTSISVNTVASTYTYGEALPTVTITHTYHDGQFKKTTGWTDAKWTQYNGPHPLDAGCTEGTTTYKLDNAAITLDANNQYTHSGTLSEGSHTFKCTTAYGPSTVTPKTSFGNNSSKSYQAGTATSNNVNFNVWYNVYVALNVALPNDYTTLMTDGNKIVLDTTGQKVIMDGNDPKVYAINPGSNMVIIIPTTKDFTIVNEQNIPSAVEFKTNFAGTVTDANNVTYNVYYKPISSTASVTKYQALTFMPA